jgi:tight adherence protein B
MVEFLLLLLVMAAVTAGFMSVFMFVRAARERRRSYWERRLPQAESEEPLIGALPKRAPRNWRERLDQAFDSLVYQTGLAWSSAQALGWVAFGGVLLAGVLFLWRDELWLVGLGLLSGMGVPLFVYLVLQVRRRRLMQNQLPDTFYLLARSLRAGLSLEQSLENVAEHGVQPLAAEFRRGIHQVKLGLTIPAALDTMARRIRLTDFNVLVTIVTLHRNIGGNLMLLLDRVATSTRDRNLFRGQFRAATALARITAFCLAAGAPFVFLGYSLWQPDFIARFTESANGWRILATAGALEIIGVIWLAVLLRDRY